MYTNLSILWCPSQCDLRTEIHHLWGGKWVCSAVFNNLHILKTHIIGNEFLNFILGFQSFLIKTLKCSGTKGKVYKHSVNSVPTQEFILAKKTTHSQVVTMICTHLSSICRVRDYDYQLVFYIVYKYNKRNIPEFINIKEKILSSYILTCPSPGIPPPSRRSLSISLEKQKQRKNVPKLWSVY